MDTHYRIQSGRLDPQALLDESTWRSLLSPYE